MIMRKETKENNVKLVEFYPEVGEWAVRWDFSQKQGEEGTYWFEETTFNYIPTIEDIQQVIIRWLNQQTDSVIRAGFVWKGIEVFLNDENKFNFKAITDEATRREEAIAIWDKENPELAGVYSTTQETVDGQGVTVQKVIPTGRPKSLLPATLKLGRNNTAESFYVFETLSELQQFFSDGVDHLVSAYGVGWYRISTFDWLPYAKALEEL